MELDKALLTGIVALMVAVLAWLKQRDVARLTAVHTRELQKLRSELSGTEARLRNDLARDLAAHESALRIRAEVRLRLFERSARSAQRVVRALSRLGVQHIDLALSKGKIDWKEFETAKSLPHIGLFLPPELDDPFGEASQVFLNAFSAYYEAGDSVEAREEAIAAHADKLGEALKRFRKHVRDWKKQHWVEQAEAPTMGRQEKG